MNKPFKIIDLGFSKLELFPGYLINHCKEGVVIDYDELNSLIMIFDYHYANQKFGYISNRVHSYSVNPIMHQISESHDNIVAHAIVCYSQNCEQNIAYEQKFSRLKFQLFSDLRVAQKWMEDVLEKRKKAGL